jgi:DNA-directed RNA polymerase specialized sigma24 family protein
MPPVVPHARPVNFDFPSTHWTLVGEACRGTPDERREALGQLLRRYIGPLQAYVRRRWRLGEAEAEELVQDFFATHVIEREVLAHADQVRGRFRDFLQTVLNNSVREEFRRGRRLKRGGGTVGLLDEVPEPAGAGGNVSRMFDIEWARAVLVEAAERMRLHCERIDRADLWRVFDARVLGPTLREGEVVSYHELVERFGIESPEKASNLLMTAKRMYARSLRAVVGEYALGEAAVEEEIADLHRILGGG